jgi:hypothetical protein
MFFNGIKMDSDFLDTQSETGDGEILDEHSANEEIVKLRNDFQIRLVAANLRTEAVRAGMIDLDGLRLIDLSSVHLDEQDKIVGGRKIMTELRRTKPWLFGSPSTSSAAVPPASLPVRQKSAMDMTNEEYAVARTAVIKHHF